MSRKVDDEGCSPEVRRLDVDPAAVPLHDLAGDVQAEAQAPGIVRLRCAPDDPLERAEDLGQHYAEANSPR